MADVRDTQNQSDVRNIEMLAKYYDLPCILTDTKNEPDSKKEIGNLTEKEAVVHFSMKSSF